MMHAQVREGLAKVLCVDDDAHLTALLRFALSREGYAVQIANRGSQAMNAVKDDPPSIVVLDVNLPDVDGFVLCELFRSTYQLPVIMLTARHDDDDAIRAFGLGADDYVAKPFNMQLLVCRVRAVLRRLHSGGLPWETLDKSYQLGDGLYDTKYNEIVHGSSRVRLTPTEGKILRLLLAHEGHVFPAESIMEHVWGYDSESSYTVIKTHIRRLRAKLAATLGDVDAIHTVPGVGYSFRRTPPNQPRLETAG